MRYSPGRTSHRPGLKLRRHDGDQTMRGLSFLGNALTNEQYKGYAILFWKVGLINEAQFDALVAEHNSHNGKTFPAVIEQLEAELRK